MNLENALSMTFILMLITINTVNATSCLRPTPESALEEAQAVFVGRITNIERGVVSEKITFEKEKAWKQPDKNRMAIIYNDREGYHGDPLMPGIGYREFEEGESYLIYAYKVNGKFWTSICGVKKLSEASEDIEELDRLTKQNEIKDIDYNIFDKIWKWFRNLFSIKDD